MQVTHDSASRDPGASTPSILSHRAGANAVPPSGIDGVGASDRLSRLQYGESGVLSIGPLTIGNLKYKTEFGLFRFLQESPKPALLDFPEAYEFALGELRKSLPSVAAA